MLNSKWQWKSEWRFFWGKKMDNFGLSSALDIRVERFETWTFSIWYQNHKARTQGYEELPNQLIVLIWIECIFHDEFEYRNENLNLESFWKKLENLNLLSGLEIRVERFEHVKGEHLKHLYQNYKARAEKHEELLNQYWACLYLY